jgi:hypothetical protein
MAGVPAVPRGQHPWAQACQFVFPPSLVEVELGCECGGRSFFVSGFALQVPSSFGPRGLVN